MRATYAVPVESRVFRYNDRFRIIQNSPVLLRIQQGGTSFCTVSYRDVLSSWVAKMVAALRPPPTSIKHRNSFRTVVGRIHTATLISFAQHATTMFFPHFVCPRELKPVPTIHSQLHRVFCASADTVGGRSAGGSNGTNRNPAARFCSVLSSMRYANVIPNFPRLAELYSANV